MFGSVILEVAISIIFIYLFISLIATSVMETIASLFNMRAKNLEKGISSILKSLDNPASTIQFYDHPLIQCLSNEPWLKFISKEKRKPSYIPTRTFALTFLEAIRNTKENMDTGTLSANSGKPVFENLKKITAMDIKEIITNPSEAIENIEKLFDDTMARVSGWYKRKTQIIIYIIAALITIALNVDTISIASRLYHDSALRSSMAAVAETISSKPLSGDENSKQIREILGEIKGMELPIGWKKSASSVDQTNASGQSQGQANICGNSGDLSFYGCISKIVGWMITVVAVSMGAPFWFEQLSNFIRFTGKKPPETSGRSQ